jgi:hypothetical protein
MSTVPTVTTKHDDFRARLGELNPEALLADGLDDALIGFASRCGMESVAVYDREKCIEVLMRDQDFTYEGAAEWMDFNVEGAYLGSGTPMYMTLIENVS